MLQEHREGFLSDILVKFERYIRVNHIKKKRGSETSITSEVCKGLEKERHIMYS